MNLTGRSKSLGQDYSRRIILHKNGTLAKPLGRAHLSKNRGGGGTQWRVTGLGH